MLALFACAPAGLGNDYSESDPVILPDGEHVLIVVGDKRQQGCIELRSLTSSETKFVLEDGRPPAYSGDFLFFLRNQKIFAQPFDAGSGKVSGTATLLADADWCLLAGPSVLAFQTVSHDTRLQRFDMSRNSTGTIGQVAYEYLPAASDQGFHFTSF